jgi:KUP system potassium uptake protein
MTTGTTRPSSPLLLMGALGIVFGDIGTSPIYTLRESLRAAGGTDPGTVLGVLSLIAWTVILIVSGKYVLLVMRADNGGEGGIMSLLSVALPGITNARLHFAMLLVGIAGAALFYGDGMVTPAISVLSAVEGLAVIAPAFAHLVVPLTVAILVALFVAQSWGSERIGGLFGPVMLAWFTVLAGLGLAQVWQAPVVLRAIDPSLAVRFLLAHPASAFATLGAVFLSVTGAEALYADMGHFGRGPIRLDWALLVLPALLLNYAGQAALVLRHPEAAANPFFSLAPGWWQVPLVVLATFATVIAAQAVISGAFSLTQQAMQLGLLPRLEVRQTSATARGQVYVPAVNWLLMLAVLALVLGFRSSDALASAYGIAVTGTMLVTTLLLVSVMRRAWGWPWLVAGGLGVGLLAMEGVFFAANALKILQGGWVPLLVGAVMFGLMLTWRRGRRVVLERLDREMMDEATLLRRMREGAYARVPGTAIYLTSRKHGVPAALNDNLRHNGVLHATVVMLTVETVHSPHIPLDGAMERHEVAPGLIRVVLRFGFAGAPDLPEILRHHRDTLGIDPDAASYFTGRELPVPSLHPDLPRWLEPVFAVLTRNAASAADYFCIPSRQVIELGTRVEI